MCSGCGLCRNLSAGVGFGVLTKPECFASQRTAGHVFCKLDSPRAHFSLSSYASNRESTVVNALFSSTHEGQGHPSLSAGVEGIWCWSHRADSLRHLHLSFPWSMGFSVWCLLFCCFRSHLQGKPAFYSLYLLYCKWPMDKGRLKAVWKTGKLVRTVKKWRLKEFYASLDCGCFSFPLASRLKHWFFLCGLAFSDGCTCERVTSN